MWILGESSCLHGRHYFPSPYTFLLVLAFSFSTQLACNVAVKTQVRCQVFNTPLYKFSKLWTAFISWNHGYSAKYNVYQNYCWSSKIALWVTELATKTNDDQCLIPRTHMLEGEPTPSCPLTSPHTPWAVHTHTHAHYINIIFKVMVEFASPLLSC